MKKVLWLASWYPNEADPFSGDFIKRMAEAVSADQPVNIIFVGKQPDKKTLDSYEKSNIEKTKASLSEFIEYYPSAGVGLGVLSKISSLYAYFKSHLKIIREFRKNNELPDIVHVQVAMKAGLVALYLKWKYKIPFVLTEHWSGYYEQSRDSLFRKSFLDKYLTRRILKHAALVLPVSEDLGRQINHYWAHVPFQKIPNVVNTRFFSFPENQPPDEFRFIHVSTLLYPKNIEGIIRSFGELLKQGFRAELVFVGPVNPGLSDILAALPETRDKIQFTGEVSYERVSMELKKSSALVMFSFYENMPCTILEALCTGLPVIASRVGGIPELIQKENGILVQPGNEGELTSAMKNVILHYHQYDKEKISRDAVEFYSYESISKKIRQVYQSVLENG
jgi:glycosyltransferase involved in cell wall biosynthesis